MIRLNRLQADTLGTQDPGFREVHDRLVNETLNATQINIPYMFEQEYHRASLPRPRPLPSYPSEAGPSNHPNQLHLTSAPHQFNTPEPDPNASRYPLSNARAVSVSEGWFEDLGTVVDTTSQRGDPTEEMEHLQEEEEEDDLYD
ncbi:hypothetical protein FRC12_001471 [Ceratobasidium sp. 428]|nr:hypothetical protein FRC12_001471 [Ceratobasidium sp. 428]